MRFFIQKDSPLNVTYSIAVLGVLHIIFIKIKLSIYPSTVRFVTFCRPSNAKQECQKMDCYLNRGLRIKLFGRLVIVFRVLNCSFACVKLCTWTPLQSEVAACDCCYSLTLLLTIAHLSAIGHSIFKDCLPGLQ